MATNQKIVNELIACKQEYDKLYLDFPFKSDLEALFKHEYDYYLQPIFKKIVPMIYKDWKVNPELEIEEYYPYIVFKYQEIVKKEVVEFERNNAAIIRGMAKTILDSFVQQLMSLSKESQEIKMNFITEHFKAHVKEWNLLFRSNPQLAFETCAKLRNPIMQNTIIKYFENEMKAYIETKSWENFQEELLPFFIYPLDIQVNEYYDKWIAKECIHVKLASKILGDHYEPTKKLLKDNEIAENYRRKQEHYEKVQRKRQRLAELKKQESDK